MFVTLSSALQIYFAKTLAITPLVKSFVALAGTQGHSEKPLSCLTVSIVLPKRTTMNAATLKSHKFYSDTLSI